MTLPADYFSRMYADNDDPWGFRTRWYERRKREVTLAALTRPRYRRAFEPGCSIGVLTQGLATRCDELIATDLDAAAVSVARSAMPEHSHVRLSTLSVPTQWPTGTFDLVVLSELGYYLDPADLLMLLTRSVESLEVGGTLLAVHWRHPVADYPQTGDAVHGALMAMPGLVPAVSHLEEDFRLDLLTRERVESPARREGLVS